MMTNITTAIDPRVRRLPQLSSNDTNHNPSDDFAIFQVLVKESLNKPFQCEGIVHAPNRDMAYVFAKETFTRRFKCVAMGVVAMSDIYKSQLTEGKNNAYDTLGEYESEKIQETYEIYHMPKRGKRHVYVGTVMAVDYAIAITTLYKQNDKKLWAHNVWSIKKENIRYVRDHEKDLWFTLPEKDYRNATAYRGSERLKMWRQNKTI